MKNTNSKIIIVSMILIILIFTLLLTRCDRDSKINNSTNNTNNIANEEKSDFKIGEYFIQIDTSILTETDGLVGDESIEFLEHNKFNAYTGFGNGVAGTYSISNNEILCIADTFYSEYGPEQKINTTLTFKINSNSQIEIINTSDIYTINIVDIINNTLTDETKEMSLWPFIVGIKFNLSI